MSDLYDRIVSQRAGLQSLLQRIPGFRGYNDRADRRTADTMVRNHIAGEISKRLSRFASIEMTLVDNGGLSYMSKSRDAKTKLQIYHDRLKAASPGYSGFFAAIKVNETELESLYSFDEAQIRYVDKLDAALDQFEQAVNSKEGIDTAIAALQDLAVEANEAFSLRENVLTNLDRMLS